MTIACCDRAALPNTNGESQKRIKDPNGPLALPTGQWIKFYAHYPSIVEISGGSGIHSVYAYPEKPCLEATLANLTVHRAQALGPQRSILYLNAIGPWQVKSEGQDLIGTIRDAHDGFAALFYSAAAQETGGALTMPVPGSVAVGVASGLALAANPLRKFVYFRNVSTAGQVISLGFDGAPAILNDGITLNVDDWVAFSRTEFCSIGLVNAIASAAAGKLAFQEGT